MIRRETDPEVVNRLLQRDYPTLDYSEVLAEPLHICLVEGDSGAIFAWRGPGIYEAHVFFSVRGRDALDLAARMQADMQERGARKLWSLIPDDDRRVKLFLRHLGWKPGGQFKTRNGPQEYYSMEMQPCRQ